MAETQQTYSFSVPLNFNSRDRVRFAQRVIDFIVRRTDRGRDVNNNKFAGYSTTYKASDDFKNAGKNSTVNLQLSGDMITSLQLLTHTVGLITIGYIPDTEENDKAAWNKASDNGPSRTFLGVTPTDLNKLINNYRNENPIIQEAESIIQEQAERLLAGLLTSNSEN